MLPRRVAEATGELAPPLTLSLVLRWNGTEVKMWDVVVVGAGPAGLSAALVFGRSRRRTLVLGHGAPRNAPADAAHNLFTRDGTPPLELLRTARDQLRPYDGVELRDAEAVEARREDDVFVVRDATGGTHRARAVLLAGGVEDLLPPIDGMRRLWGRSVLHCPYCHGWEVRDRRLAVLGDAHTGPELAQLVRGWSRDLMLCTDGAVLADEDRARLARAGVGVREARLVALEGGDALERLVFADGSRIERDALFVRPPQRVRGAVAAALGCALTEDGLLRVGDDWQTTVPGVYAAGDAASRMQQVVIAAASGTAAAIHLNRAFLAEDFAAAAREPLATAGA